MQIKKGDRVGCRDEDGYQTGEVIEIGVFVLVLLDSGVLWPLRFDEILPPF